MNRHDGLAVVEMARALLDHFVHPVVGRNEGAMHALEALAIWPGPIMSGWVDLLVAITIAGIFSGWLALALNRTPRSTRLPPSLLTALCSKGATKGSGRENGPLRENKDNSSLYVALLKGATLPRGPLSLRGLFGAKTAPQNYRAFHLAARGLEGRLFDTVIVRRLRILGLYCHATSIHTITPVASLVRGVRSSSPAEGYWGCGGSDTWNGDGLKGAPAG
jgi:hypothetical protein